MCGFQFWARQDEPNHEKTAKHMGKNGGMVGMAFPFIHLSNNEPQIHILDQKSI